MRTSFEIVKAGLIDQNDFLSAEEESLVFGGRGNVKCSQGFVSNAEGIICNCGYSSDTTAP